MSNTTNFTLERVLTSFGWGGIGGCILDTAVYPLEVLKVRQQLSPQDIKAYQLARTLFQQEGMSAFYRGLSFQLAKTVRQIWSWPMITEIPRLLENYSLGDLQKKAIVGGCIATTSALLVPLEKAKIQSAGCVERSAFSIRNISRDEWRGFTIYTGKLYTGWMSFLMAQQYFRDQSGIPLDQPLPLSKAIGIGTKSALVQSIVWAPFDYMSTQKLAKNLGPSHLLSRAKIRRLYRGWPVSTCSLVLKNIVLAHFLDEVNRRTCKKSDSTLP